MKRGRGDGFLGDGEDAQLGSGTDVIDSATEPEDGSGPSAATPPTARGAQRGRGGQRGKGRTQHFRRPARA